MPHLDQCHNVRGIACVIAYVMPYLICGISRGIAHFVALVVALVSMSLLNIVKQLEPINR